MPSIIFDRFELGLDLRKDRSTADSNRLRELKNAYVTSGWTIRKRPGMRYVGDAPPNTAGLMPYSGQLVCFTNGAEASRSMSDGTPLVSKSVPHPDDDTLTIKEMNQGDTYDGFIFVSVKYDDNSSKMHYIDEDSDPTGPWVITDENCPHSENFTILGGSIYAIDGDTVAFNSAEDGPHDWTSDKKAGFLPTGLRAPGDPIAQAVGEFNAQLAVLMEDSVQIWFVDPDPDKTFLDKTLQNVGTSFPHSVWPVSNDLYFLSDYGFRSVAQQKYTEQYQDVDVGAAIDEIVVPHLEVNSSETPRSTFFGRNGQYWCSVGTRAWVYTYSRTSKVSAWSKYDLPFVVTDFANLGNRMYVRAGDRIYKVDVDYYLDDGALFDVDILMSYQSFKESGIIKMISQADVALNGTADFAVRYLIDQNEPGQPPVEEETENIELTGDSRPGAKVPVEVMATEVAAHVTHERDEAFELNLLQFYYESLGPM